MSTLKRVGSIKTCMSLVALISVSHAVGMTVPTTTNYNKTIDDECYEILATFPKADKAFQESFSNSWKIQTMPEVTKKVLGANFTKLAENKKQRLESEMNQALTLFKHLKKSYTAEEILTELKTASKEINDDISSKRNTTGLFYSMFGAILGAVPSFFLYKKPFFSTVNAGMYNWKNWFSFAAPVIIGTLGAYTISRYFITPDEKLSKRAAAIDASATTIAKLKQESEIAEERKENCTFAAMKLK